MPSTEMRTAIPFARVSFNTGHRVHSTGGAGAGPAREETASRKKTLTANLHRMPHNFG